MSRSRNAADAARASDAARTRKRLEVEDGATALYRIFSAGLDDCPPDRRAVTIAVSRAYVATADVPLPGLDTDAASALRLAILAECLAARGLRRLTDRG
jgi:hypothetical protein